MAAGTPSFRIVVETRRKTYPVRSRANRAYKWKKIWRRRRNRKNGRRRFEIEVRVRNPDSNDRIADSGGDGREISREVVACPDCAARQRMV